MPKKIHTILILCLLTILWPLHGFTMEPIGQNDDKDLSSTKPMTLSGLGLVPSRNIPIKHPKHYEYFLIKYAYSDKYIRHIQWCGNDKDYNPFAFKSYTRLGYEIKPLADPEIPAVIKWKVDRTEWCKKYEEALKQYNRAQNDPNKTREEKVGAANAFQPILRESLRRHSSDEKILGKLQKIEEEKKKLITNTIKESLANSQVYKQYVEAKAALRENPIDLALRENFGAAEKELLFGKMAELFQKNKFFTSSKEFLLCLEEIEKNPNQENIDFALINTDLYPLYKTEFDAIEKIIFNKGLSKETAEPQGFLEPFAIELDKIQLNIQRLRKLNNYFKKYNKLQEKVALFYNRDYLPETSSTWSSKQWKNWWHGNKIEEVKRKIKESIEEDFPRNAYRVRLLGSNPSDNILKSIGPRELALYLKDNMLLWQVIGKEPEEIKQTTRTGTSGLRVKIFQPLIEALTTGKEVEITLEAAWQVLDCASICGYLPDDFSVEEMSRLKKDRRNVLDILFARGWELQNGIWEKRGKPAVTPEAEKMEIAEEDKTFLQYWKPFCIHNDLFTYIEKAINPIIIKNPIVTLEEVDENSKTVWKAYPQPINLNYLDLNQYQQEDGTYPEKSITYADIKSHRQKLLAVMATLKKEVKVVDPDEPLEVVKAIEPVKCSLEDLAVYSKLCNDFEKVLKRSRELEFIMDKPYSWLIQSHGLLYTYLPTVSYIPKRRTFFASDSLYAQRPPIQEIDLSSNNLFDSHFFEVLPQSTDHAPAQAKQRQEEVPLLAGYKIIILSHNELNGLKPLPFPNDLESLFLSHNQLTSCEILNLSKGMLPKLTRLDLSYNPIQSLDGLANRSTITHLDLSYSEISDIQRLCDNITALKVLNLSGNKKLFENQQVAFKCLDELVALEELLLVACNLKGEFVEFFPQEMKKMRVLDVDGNPEIIFPDTKAALKGKLPNLKSLRTDTVVITWD